MPQTYENWLGLVNHCIYYASICENYTGTSAFANVSYFMVDAEAKVFV